MDVSSHSPTPHPTPEDCLTILQILDDNCIDLPSSGTRTFKRIRRVRFSAEQCSTSSRYSPQNADRLWYQPAEIISFKQQARKLVKASRSSSFHNDDMMRGLESCTLERQLNRHKTIQCILSAYKKGMKPDDTAKIAKICAAWSEEVAFVQACHDYCNVYQPTMKGQIPQISNTPPEFPFTLRRGKSRSNNRDQSSSRRRRVRRHMT
jgi:hypothetical protein